MKKSCLLGAVCILLLSLQAISIKPAKAAVLTFEEVVLEQREGVYLNESGPFSLHHLNYLNVDVGWYAYNYSAFSFSDSLTVSPPNAVGLDGDSPYNLSLIDGGLFNFQGVYFGAENTGTSVEVSGYSSNGQITYTDSISIGSSETPVWFNANWNDVVRIKIERGFVLHGYTTLDNFTYSVVPIPPAAWQFATGLLGLVGMARRKT